MQVRSLGFLTDLAVLRAGGSSIVDGDDHLVVRTADNPGYWWGNFVLVGDPDGTGAGLEIFRREFPAAAHVAIGVDGPDGASPASATTLGLDAETSVVLTAPALGNPAPVDARVRPLTRDRDWRDLLALRSTDEHPGRDTAFQQARVATARRLTGTGRGVFLGAFRGPDLVAALGIVSDGATTARYQEVMTHPGHRRQGLATHLVAAAADLARRRWAPGRLVIVADPDGPAIGLYRRLGFRDTELQVQLSEGPAPGG